MSTENIIQNILDGNISAAKTRTEELLYSKVGDAIELVAHDVTSGDFIDSVGAASLVEKKNKKKNDDEDEDEYAKATDKEDDGEGLDPVDAEDDDVDNDGDEDESDEYLNNRRKVRKKAIKGED